uniref:hypothetical protein n=1 Tax=Polynucleobacter sp. TaxID=2029855 RepID=UPI0040477B9C
MKLNNIIFYDDFLHPAEAKLLKKKLSKQFNLIVVNSDLINFFLNDKVSFDKKNFQNLYVSYQNIEFKQKRIINIVNWLVGRYNPVAAVFGFDGFLYESLMSNAFKTLGIKTISVAHSGLGHIKNFDGIGTKNDYLLCWNEYDKAALVKNNDLDGCKIIDIGALKYLKEYDLYESNAKRNIEKISNNILICTSNINTGLSLIISDPKRHQNNLNQIKFWAKERPDKIFYIKCHPSYDYYSYYEYLFIDIKNIKIVKSNDVIKNIKFDVGIAMNYCTTYLLELMLKRIPVVLYEESIYSTDGSKNILPDDIIKRLSDFIQLKILIDDINSLNNILSSQDFYIRAIVNKNDISKFISEIKLSLTKQTVPISRNSSVEKLMEFIMKIDIFSYFICSLRKNNIIKFDDYLYFIGINNYYGQSQLKVLLFKFLMIPFVFKSVRNKRLIKGSLW